MKKLGLLLTLLLVMAMGSHRVFAQSVTVVLTPGWNWISVPLMDTLDFQTAMGSVTPVVGDIIKSRWGSATYIDDGQWRGSISQFYPGYGYHYKSNRMMPIMLTFTAQQPAPQVVVTTSEPTEITAISAVVGSIVTIGESNHIFARGVCWSMEPNPAIDGNHISDDLVVGSLSITLEGLTLNTTYYVRAYAVTDYGLAYGNELTFTTLEGSSGGDYDYVDLGLPSGILWATCNVGATVPEDYGDYFAWGETESKTNYGWNTYQYCMGNLSLLTKYCNNSSYGYNGFTDNLTILEPSDDATTVNLGADWRMPTKEEWQELFSHTTLTYTFQNNVYGLLFTSWNGSSLFLPASGYRNMNSLYDAGIGGHYWSSSLYHIPYNALLFNFNSNDSGNYGMNYYNRNFGLSIRAVRNAE